MAYPMMQWPSFAEFRNRLVDEFGCTYKQLPHSLAVTGGEPLPVYYLERVVDGRAKQYSVAIADGERVDPVTIRSICRHLEVDAAAFGLHLG